MTKNISMIDKSKRNIVQRLCELCENTPIVIKLIIFGSAAANTCTEDSDIDICFYINTDVSDKRAFNLTCDAAEICDDNCDILYSSLIGSGFLEKIEAEGVVVYEQDNCLGECEDG